MSGHGPEWLKNMFTTIGDTDDSENFLIPNESEDVWKFLIDASCWAADYNRSGMNET